MVYPDRNQANPSTVHLPPADPFWSGTDSDLQHINGNFITCLSVGLRSRHTGYDDRDNTPVPAPSHGEPVPHRSWN